MLTNTFIHIEGIGEKNERALWNSGIKRWEDLQLSGRNGRFPERWFQEVENSQNRYREGDAAYFCGRLQSKDKWRLFREFKESCAYIDIETTGLAPQYDIITTIALYNGSEIKWYVNGINLDEFPKEIENYSLIATYNGKAFDVPFINRFFNIKLNNAHIDLRYLLADLGYKGGLKNIEKQFGVSRGELEGVDGYTAVLLWKEYRKGSQAALETLLAYNIEDVVNLELLLHFCYNKKLETTPFAELNMPYSGCGLELPFKPDLDLIRKITPYNLF